jgi:glycosyltransferase involved in cell wall biosynthesis
MLSGGAGLVVDHEPSSLAEALRTLLEDDHVYHQALRAAASRSSEISWETGARAYADLVRSLVPSEVSINN